jgi:septal ring factor EnvC (AmiA/AmiB activator)
MDMISTYWEQILLIGALIFHAARSYAQISEMRKDIDSLQTEVRRYTDLTQRQSEQLVQLRAEMDVVNKQVTSLWEFTNGLRDRLNGHGKTH